MLEYDFKFAPAGKYRDDLQFRLAAYYLQSENDTAKTFPLLQDLAIRGHHLDAMCFLGTVWMEGQYVDADPKKACVWFSQAADGGHRQACYEMGVALYTGEGMAENESMAVEYFERAASMGHPAAAYMLGDCLLDGVGVLRDRGEAMEWLVAAGEMGHRGARSRVLAVLEKQNGTAAAQDSGKFTDGSRQSFRRRRSSIKELKEEDTKWTEEDLQRLVTIERTFTIGGGSRNPVVLEKRKTVVAESREEEEQAKNQDKK
jgi:TPR repeat protein